MGWVAHAKKNRKKFTNSKEDRAGIERSPPGVAMEAKARRTLFVGPPFRMKGSFNYHRSMSETALGARVKQVMRLRVRVLRLRCPPAAVRRAVRTCLAWGRRGWSRLR